ncbi:MAG: 16S rRNA methyltransferase [Thermoprotei archaeon]|nr:16S rRNA methyltransferase [TACK group archaeon]
MARVGYLLLLASSALELVPKELWNGKQVLASARKRGKPPREMLLDVSVHGWDMKVLPERWARGRPDIVHVALLTAMDSPLYLEGKLEIYVHTRDGRLMEFKKGVRLPRNYEQFKGLMEQLLVKSRVPVEGEPLIWISDQSLEQLLRGRRVYVLELPSPPLSGELPDGAAFVVGGFQGGPLSSSIKSLGEVRSVYSRQLTTNAVVSLLLCSLEGQAGIDRIAFSSGKDGTRS